MIFPEKPGKTNNIKNTLVVGGKNYRLPNRYKLSVFNFDIRKNEMHRANQEKIQVINTFFMRFVAKYIQTNPLNGMEQTDKKQKP